MSIKPDVMNNQVIIKKLKQSEIPEAAELLADAMSTNPNHIAIFGPAKPKAVEKQRNMFSMVLKNATTDVYTAKLDDKIVGVMAYMSSDHCQMKPMHIIGSLPNFARMFGSDLLPVLRWRMNWAKHDCCHPHIHFGPVAVSPRYQGRGIGKTLLHHFTSYLDASHQTGYLETDKYENVGLYQKFGFEITATDRLNGQTNWFMTRKKTMVTLVNQGVFF